MARLTFNIELASKPDRLGRSSIMIRLHMKDQKPGRVLTSVKIEKADKFWSRKNGWGKWVIKHPDRESINEQIYNEYKRIKEQVEIWQKEDYSILLTPLLLAKRFRFTKTDRYFDLMEEVLEEAKAQAYSTYINKLSAAKNFRDWVGKDLLLQSITPQLCQQYQDRLRKEEIGEDRRRTAATINKQISQLHALHKAILKKTGISSKKADFLSPWTDIDKLTEIKPRKAKFSPAVIQQVAAISLPSTRRKLSPESAFHVWLLAHLLAGMRFSDVLQLRYRNFELDETGKPVHLKYEMVKTGNQVSIPIYPDGQILLERYWNKYAKPSDYVLPYLRNNRPYSALLTQEQYRNASFEIRKQLHHELTHWNRQVNLCLKELEQAAGLTEKLRTHNARHSFAELARTIMQNDKTITVYDIQLMLGHSSVVTTEKYYKDGSNQDSTEAMNAIFNRKEK